MKPRTPGSGARRSDALAIRAVAAVLHSSRSRRWEESSTIPACTHRSWRSFRVGALFHSQDAVFLFPDAARASPRHIPHEALRAVYVDWKSGGQANYFRDFGDEWWSAGSRP